MNALRTQDEDDASHDDEATARVRHSAVSGIEMAGMRADQVAAQVFPEYSRARLTEWIKRGELRIDGRQVKPKESMRGGERLEIDAEIVSVGDAKAEAMVLSVLFEDDDLLIIDKPAGLVVHPGAGNPTGTLVNGLLHLDPTLAALPRAGIVHRLDKDTSGCLLVARTMRAHAALVALLSARDIHRQYEAIVQGEPVAGSTVDAPIGRHPVDRLRMAVNENGRPAVTHYRIRERFKAFTSLQVNLETGRTHQIRVHMLYKKLPLLGDPLYGASLRLPKGASDELIERLRGFKRQALHAEMLRFVHPFTGAEVEVTAPRPDDLRRLIASLKAGGPPA